MAFGSSQIDACPREVSKPTAPEQLIGPPQNAPSILMQASKSSPYRSISTKVYFQRFPSPCFGSTAASGVSTFGSSMHLYRRGRKMAGPDFWIASVVAVIIHEAAHVAIAWTHGVKIKRVGISWRGPFIVREQGEPTADAKIAIAGPLANLLLALACWHLAPLFAQINLILGGYNLLPFIPRNDGRHAWDAVRRMRNAPAGL